MCHKHVYSNHMVYYVSYWDLGNQDLYYTDFIALSNNATYLAYTKIWTSLVNPMRVSIDIKM